MNKIQFNNNNNNNNNNNTHKACPYHYQNITKTICIVTI